MLNTAETLKGYKIHGLDGEIGSVKEFYFDDRFWTIRYLIADTGNWLMNNQVLISPHAMGVINKEEKYIMINLTKKQIENCPPLEKDKPVSRQFEESYYGYYGYPVYWGGIYMWGAYPNLIHEHLMRVQSEKTWDANLRSTQEVKGYNIQAIDGVIGHVDDFIIDDENLTIRYFQIDTNNWWSGKKVLVCPQWIDSIDYNESKVIFKLHRKTIKQSPEYSKELLLSREYENALYQHYNRKGYWIEEPEVL